MEEGIEFIDSILDSTVLRGSDADKIWVCDSDDIAVSLTTDGVATSDDDNGCSVSTADSPTGEVETTEEEETTGT